MAKSFIFRFLSHALLFGAGLISAQVGIDRAAWKAGPSIGIEEGQTAVTIDLAQDYILNCIRYKPSTNDNFDYHEIYVSLEGQRWLRVAYGKYHNVDKEARTTCFTAIPARYLRFLRPNTNQAISMDQIDILSPDPKAPVSSFERIPVDAGQWNPTIDLPLVASAGANLEDGKVLLWSSSSNNNFGAAVQTRTVVYDSVTRQLSELTHTGHDMFCPGISLDPFGSVIVSGGNHNKRTSSYDERTGQWTLVGELNRGRGYHSSVTISDGRIFTIGGSWSGGDSLKTGEVYDPVTKAWTALPQCPVEPILTKDKEGQYRADNHAWLFGWKQNSILHAGPSSNMNWYTVDGEGGQKGAGTRGSDPDSMCGIFAMYDAVNGKVLTAGGAPQYVNSQATANAHVITLGEPLTDPKVEAVSPMVHARGFANAVVLPDGKVLVSGGQQVTVPFTETASVMTTEIWDPKTSTFTEAAPLIVPQVYHSIALLLPDATVLSAGGGLCGGCSVNRFVAQIYRPRYLTTADGRPALRPRIRNISTGKVAAGGSITVNTNMDVNEACLIRFGSVTHSVNTDQRRIPLEVSAPGSRLTLKIPADNGIVIAGPYMLFVLNNGVPSVAKTVHITPGGPTVAVPAFNLEESQAAIAAANKTAHINLGASTTAVPAVNTTFHINLKGSTVVPAVNTTVHINPEGSTAAVDLEEPQAAIAAAEEQSSNIL